MRFEMEVLGSMHDRLCRIVSRTDVPPESITVADIEKILETEKFLEKLLGYRVHINQVE